MSTTSRDDIRKAFQYCYDKILGETLGVPQSETLTIAISQEEYEMARKNGWIDDSGNFTEKAYQDLENGIDNEIQKLMRSKVE